MKNKIKIIVNVIAALLIITACSPQELDEYELGAIGHISEDQVSFSYEKVTDEKINPSNSDNVIQFVNTSNINIPHSFTWDLGNGVITKDVSPIGKYPNAGKYTVVLSVSGYDGQTILKPQEITIQNDDLSLFATETYINLTGGPENLEGKIWVFDQYNNYTAEVRAALETNIGGHLGLGPQNSYSQDWWAAGPNEKGESKMYEFKFHFKQATGLQLTITNGGEGYGRAASSANPGGYDVTEAGQDDAVFNYNGGDYSFAITDGEDYEKLILPRDAFMGYYCGSQEYEIVYLTEEVMALRVDNTIEFQDWVFIYIREDLNVGEPPIVKTPQEVPIFEDFEKTETTFLLNYENMGNSTKDYCDNPYICEDNPSFKVFRYEKPNEYWSNVSFTTIDYLFDLKEQNIIKMKVFIPSLINDFDKEGQGEDWVPDKRLQPKAAVKLQNSKLGGNAWETQAEKTFDNIELDKWVELTFDFSDSATREDFDKIVIQFGNEGHDRHGTFYFDDFSFDKSK
ncbi:MAG: hypothetical protein FWH18_07450 [Marinilabiliaceae bacterium]|nr:hypothetical protein [Marinilabiliaceae bacterium]